MNAHYFPPRSVSLEYKSPAKLMILLLCTWYCWIGRDEYERNLQQQQRQQQQQDGSRLGSRGELSLTRKVSRSTTNHFSSASATSTLDVSLGAGLVEHMQAAAESSGSATRMKTVRSDDGRLRRPTKLSEGGAVYLPVDEDDGDDDDDDEED